MHALIAREKKINGIKINLREVINTLTLTALK